MIGFSLRFKAESLEHQILAQILNAPSLAFTDSYDLHL